MLVLRAALRLQMGLRRLAYLEATERVFDSARCRSRESCDDTGACSENER